MDIKIVQEILAKHYNIKSLKISPAVTGLYNRTFIVETVEGKCVARIYASNRTKSQILFELKISDLLRKKGFPTPKIFLNTNNKQLTQATINNKQRNIIVMEFMPGRPLRKTDVGMARALAKEQALMHQVLRKIKPRQFKFKVLGLWFKWSKEEIEKTKPELKKYMIEEEYLQAFYDVKSRTEAKLKNLSRVPFAECHNDFFGNNIHIKNGKIVGILDFDNLTTSPLIFDVANTLMLWLFQVDHKHYKKIITQYVNTYNKYRKLSKLEQQLLPPLIEVRNFAVTNSLYAQGLTKQGRVRIDKTLKFYKNFKLYT